MATKLKNKISHYTAAEIVKPQEPEERNPSWFKKGHVNTKTAFLKGMVPWNKGKHPGYLQGKNHPMYGKNVSEESRRKMSEAHKKSGRMLGNKINLGRFASEETRKK